MVIKFYLGFRRGIQVCAFPKPHHPRREWYLFQMEPVSPSWVFLAGYETSFAPSLFFYLFIDISKYIIADCLILSIVIFIILNIPDLYFII